MLGHRWSEIESPGRGFLEGSANFGWKGYLRLSEIKSGNPLFLSFINIIGFSKIRHYHTPSATYLPPVNVCVILIYLI
jgi:hypothetical protein